MKEIKLSDHFTYDKLIRFTLPSILMMLVTSAYSLVDGFFVSNFVGKNTFAALNLVWPVLMILGAVGWMIGTGGNALIAKLHGEGEDRKADEIFTMFVLFILLCGAIYGSICFVLMPQISRFLGANDTIIEECIIYGRVMIAAGVFCVLQAAFQSFLVAAEKPDMGLKISIVAGIANILFDYLLICVCHLGIWGAAFGSALSWIIGASIPLIYFALPNNSRLHYALAKWDFSCLWKACSNGFSEMLTNCSMSILSMIYNYRLMSIAQENGVAAYGVIMYVIIIFQSVFMGYGMSCTSIAGYQLGAEREEELKSVFAKSLKMIIVASVLVTILSECLTGVIARIYVGYDEALMDMTIQAMRLYFLSFIFCGFNIVGSAFFTGLNDGKVSAIISGSRTFVIQIISVLILPLLLGINGIWLAIVVAEAGTLILTAGLVVKNREKYRYY